MTMYNWEDSWFARVKEVGKGFTEVSKKSWAVSFTVTFKARIILFILQNCKLGTNHFVPE